MPPAEWLSSKLSESRKFSRASTVWSDLEYEGATPSRSFSPHDTDPEVPPKGFSKAFWERLDTRAKMGVKAIFAFLITSGFLRLPPKVRGAIALAGTGAVVVLSGTDIEGAEEVLDVLTDPSTALGAAVAIGVDFVQVRHRTESAEDFNQAWTLATAIFGVLVATMSGSNAYMKYAHIARAMRADAGIIGKAFDIFRSQKQSFLGPVHARIIDFDAKTTDELEKALSLFRTPLRDEDADSTFGLARSFAEAGIQADDASIGSISEAFEEDREESMRPSLDEEETKESEGPRLLTTTVTYRGTYMSTRKYAYFSEQYGRLYPQRVVGVYAPKNFVPLDTCPSDSYRVVATIPIGDGKLGFSKVVFPLKDEFFTNFENIEFGEEEVTFQNATEWTDLELKKIFDEQQKAIKKEEESAEDFSIEEGLDAWLPKSIASLFDPKNENFLLKKSWVRHMLRILLAVLLSYTMESLIKKDPLSEIPGLLANGTLIAKLQENKYWIGLTAALTGAGAFAARKYLYKLVAYLTSPKYFTEVLLISGLSTIFFYGKRIYQGKMDFKAPVQMKDSSYTAMAKSFFWSKVETPTDLQELYADCGTPPSDGELRNLLSQRASYSSSYDTGNFTMSQALTVVERFVKDPKAEFETELLTESAAQHISLRNVMDAFATNDIKKKVLAYIKEKRYEYATLNTTAKVAGGFVALVGAGLLAHTAYAAFFNQKKGKKEPNNGKVPARKAQRDADKKKPKTDAWQGVPFSARAQGLTKKEYERQALISNFCDVFSLNKENPETRVRMNSSIEANTCLNHVYNARGCKKEDCRREHSDEYREKFWSKYSDLDLTEEGKRRNRNRKKGLSIVDDDPSGSKKADLPKIYDDAISSEDDEEIVDKEQIVNGDAFGVAPGSRTMAMFDNNGNFQKNAVILNSKFGLTCNHAPNMSIMVAGKKTPVRQVQVGKRDIAYFVNPATTGYGRRLPFRKVSEKKDKKIYIVSRLSDGTVVKNRGTLLDIKTGHHTCNTQPGFSGSPIFSEDDDQVVGIHSGAVNGKPYNKCVLIDDEIWGVLHSLDFDRKA